MTRSDFERLFDAYIDGMLEGKLLERFEAHIRKHPELQARVEEHRRIDDSIRNSFAPSGGVPGLPDSFTIASATPKKSGSRRMLLAACAGLIVIGAAAMIYIKSVGSSIPAGGSTAPFVLVEPMDLYQRLESESFKPEWACANDEEFFAYTLDKFNKPFLVRETPGLTLTGWTSSQVFSRYTGVLMAKGADGADIVMIIDQARFDRQLPELESLGLHLFRREVAGLVLYEITPAAEPVILPKVYQPEIPIDPGA